MATFDWRDNVGKNLLDSGNLLGPGNSNIRDGRVRGRANTGTQRTGRQGPANELVAGANQFIGGVAPRAPTSAGNPVQRVNRALSTLESPVQRSRGEAETGANAATAEELRLSLIEQKRLRGNMQAPGSVNPVQFRAMMAERAANQASVDSLQQAVGGIREAGVTTRGQNIDAATSLTDRQMAESGAFDRASINRDVAEVQGQYGLGREFLAGTIRNQGAIELDNNVDPVTAARLRLGQDLMQQAAESGDPTLQSQVGIGMFNNLGDPSNALNVGAPEDELVTFMNDQGMEQTAPASVVRAITTARQVQQNPTAFGIYGEMTEQDVQRIAQGTPPEVIAAEQQQQMLQDQAAQRRAQEARAIARQRRQTATGGTDPSVARQLERNARIPARTNQESR